MTTLFSRIIAGELPASFVHQDALCVAFMDINPMSPGHVLVVPRQPSVTLAELPPDVVAHLMGVAVKVGTAQRSALGSLAQHVLVNDGKAASQTVPHVHVHVIPRYRGDMLKALGHVLWHVATLPWRRAVPEERRRELDAQAQRLAAALTPGHEKAR